MIISNVGLTAEQQAIVAADIAARLLVTAPAGTGKTTTLLARLEQLVRVEHARPGSQLLVVTFARAVAAEIRRRLAEVGGDVTYVRAQTFDSLATRLLSQFDPGGVWQEAGYDGRIEAATRLITNGQCDELLAEFRHVFVDEVQDLMEARVEFLGALLKHSGGGFTLFVDPAQQIYSFQANESGTTVTYATLLDIIRSGRLGAVGHASLSTNYRAIGQFPRRALQFGPRLITTDPKIGVDLKTFCLEAPVMTIRAATGWLRQDAEPSAILCRTNAEALVVSELLYGLGIDHALQRAATDRCVTPWIGAAFAEFASPAIGRVRFDEVCASLNGSFDLTPEVAWKLLKRIDRGPASVLDLRTVAQHVAMGNVPDELYQRQTNTLVVSTVHRAKGLEFERVALVGFDDIDESLPDSEELRVLYVGLTRARKDVCRLERPRTGFMKSKGNRDDRWVTRGWPSGPATHIEVLSGDVHSQDPAGRYLLTDVDPLGVQRYLREGRLKPGANVDLDIWRRSVDGEARAYYRIRHEGTTVGITSDSFSRALHSVLWHRPAPIRIEGVRVDAIDTVAGTSAAAERGGLGPAGLWLRLRIFGRGKMVNR